MKLKAIGRRLLVKRDTELLDKAFEGTSIVMPQETIDKETNGCQLWTVCDVGASAFEEEPPAVQDIDWKGRQIMTQRNPGVRVEFDVLASDKVLSEYRMISSDEVGLLVDEDGYDV